MLDAVKWRRKVPGRTRFQMRSLQWFRGCLPWHWSPVWSSPGNKRNQKSVGRFFSLSNLQVCNLRSSESWLRPRQLTHRCVHLCNSLVEVFQNLWRTLGGVFAAAGGDTFLFKVSCLAPVREVFHPAAMQLGRKQSQETAGFLGLFFFLNKWRTHTTADHRAELMETQSAATREESSISAAAPLFIVLKRPYANKCCTVC